MQKFKFTLVSLVSLQLLAPSVVLGQDDDTDRRSSTIEEIVVTAQKREESLQDVPVSIKAFSARQIEDSGVQRVGEIADLDPSVTFSKGISLAKSAVRVRGVGTSVFGTGVEPTVATLVDGVVFARGGAALDDLPDLEQVEILRGPQSTLFGKNASAGLVHIRTKNPSFDGMEGKVGTLVANDGEYKFSGTVSGPLSETTAFRLSAYRRFWDGNVTNVFNGNTLNGFDTYGLRGKVEFRPNDDLSILISADYSDQEADGGVRVLRVDSADRGNVQTDPSKGNTPPPPGVTTGTAGEITGITGGPDNDKVNLNIDPIITGVNKGVSMELNLDIGEHTLTSITAARSWEQTNLRDNDQTQLDFARIQKEDRDADWWSQELRLASPVGGFTDYVVGLFYYDSEVFDNSGDLRTFSNSPYRRTYNEAWNTVDNTNYAVFGQMNIHPSEALTVFAGLRYLKDEVEADLSKRTATIDNGAGSPAAPTAIEDARDAAYADPNQPIEASNSGSETELVGKIGAQLDWNEDVMTYASFATGYKGPAFNTDFKFNPDVFLNEEPVPGEESESIEVGLRSTLLDGRLRLNVTAFRTNFEGLQLTVRDLANNRNQLGSVKEAKTQGIEVDFEALLTESFSLKGGFTTMDANYEDFKNTPTGEDLSGKTLPNAPDLSIVLTARYDFLLGGYDAFAQLSTRYQDEVNFETLLNEAGNHESYSITNLRAGMKSKDDSFETVFFVNNLFDKQYISTTTINGGAGGDLVLQVLPRDFNRHGGIQFNYYF